MTEKLELKTINKLVKNNDRKNNKLINNTLSFIFSDEVYSNLFDTYKELNKTINIEHYEYQEILTGLATSSYLNTVDYIKELTNKDIAKKADNYLYFINKHTNNVLENLIFSLNESRNKVLEVNDEFEQYLKQNTIRVYLDFINTVKSKLGNYLIPKIIKNFNDIFNLKYDEDFLYKRMDTYILEYKNMIINKSSLILNNELKEIYKLFKINNKTQTTNENKKKIPFSDFDSSNEVFNANFEDEQIALEILGLNSGATIKEIKKAYKELANKYHPDRNKDNEFALEQMKKINNAYNLLKKRVK